MTDFTASASHISMMHRPFGPRIHMDEAAASAPAAAEAPAAPPASFSDPREAARFLSARREQGNAAQASNETESTSDDGDDTGAADETELASDEDDNAAPGEDQATGEPEDVDPADELPPLDMPRSWTKEQAEHWKALPRATQEFLTEQASKSSEAVRKAQNDAAEKSKAITAKETAAEQARANYEAQARAALDILAREQQRDFADIKTAQDVSKLAQTDPLRYIQWQAHQTELAAIKETVDAADRRKVEDEANSWRTYRAEQDAKAAETVPDLADKAKGKVLMEKAVGLLQEIGFTPQELGRLDKGEKLSLFDHRIQRVLVDAIRFQDLQKASQAARTKPVPPVQRPGVKPSGNSNSEKLQALNTRLTNSGSLKDAAALLLARRSGGRRSA